MTLFQGPDASPSGDAEAFGHMLLLFGAAGDFALGNPPGFGSRIASLAGELAQNNACGPQECDAVYLAGVLHGIGALGNGGVRRSDSLPSRAARMERWNIPAMGASLCGRIRGLPENTADIIRWHAENWDGTGYPDQLRWHGIPKVAQVLHLAQTYVSAAEPDDGLASIQESSGRIFSPEEVRAFVMWFHTTGGETPARDMPLHALHATPGSAATVLHLLGEAIDIHIGARGRCARVAERATATGTRLNVDRACAARLHAGAYLFGAGEIERDDLEGHRFDPLAGLGRELRARNATAAAALVAQVPAFAELLPILRARAEWFDGTGLPGRLAAHAIPLESRVLAVCIAYEALHEAHRTKIRDDRMTPVERLTRSAGTQFDPAVVSAFTESLKATV
ncbi:MAG: hypothetical protein M3126_03965 [Candidatus Eremiobacteraeota bacterium]|nr:hypothetical protein [Candidatus Eremiobacteraeota bacterium]